MKSKKYKRCSSFELQYAFEMREQGYSMQHIANNLRRSKSTVYGWLKAHKPQFIEERVWEKLSAYGKSRHVYNAMKVRRKLKKKGHVRCREVREYIIKRLEQKHTPEHIADTMRGDLGRKVCFKTIYNFVKKERGLKKYLREQGKKRRQKSVPRKHRQIKGAPKKRSIHKRAREANKRQEFGHFEADLIIGKCNGSKKVILSVIERLSRYKWFILIPDRKAKTVLAYLRGLMENFPCGTFKTLTLDNGGEFGSSEMVKLETAIEELLVYYADPYSSSQKGAIERANRDFRRYFPKGTDFACTNRQEVKEVTAKINNTAMKLLSWRTPQEVFDSYINKDLGIIALVA